MNDYAFHTISLGQMNNQAYHIIMFTTYIP